MILPQLGETDPVLVCDLCFQRQDFINFVFVLMHRVREMVEGHGRLEEYLKKDVAGTPSTKITFALQIFNRKSIYLENSQLDPAVTSSLRRLICADGFDVLSGISLLQTFKDVPEAFLTIIAQMAW